MKKPYLRMLMAVLSVAGLGAATNGQEVDHLTVNVPHQFVVNGQIFPAGEYELNRASDRDPTVLVVKNLRNHESVLVLTSEMKDTPNSQSSVSFEKVGGQEFLNQIQTLDHLFTIPVTREEMLAAQAKSHGASAPGSVGGR